MGILSFLRIPRFKDIPSEPVDTTVLEESFRLLQATAADVTQAAADAAKVLQKKYGQNSAREKACFEALNGVSDAVAFIDQDANVFFCNDQFVQSFGYICYRQVINRHLTEVIPPTFTKFNEMWKEVQENHPWTKRCPKIKMRVNVVPMMNGQPHPIYYICTFKAFKKA